jgi:uncharacterized protein (DUF433 family)
MDNSGTQATVIRTGRGLSIAGTRITLYDVMDYLRIDWPPALIAQWLNLSERQIADALGYIVANREEVEAEYQQVVQQAEANRVYWEARNRARINRVHQLPAQPGQESVIAKLRETKARLGLS